MKFTHEPKRLKTRLNALNQILYILTFVSMLQDVACVWCV